MTDAPWDMQTDSQQWEMVRGSGYYACEHMEKTDCGEWRHEDDHNAEVLRLRKQIWQLMREVDEARELLEDSQVEENHRDDDYWERLSAFLKRTEPADE